MKNVKGFTLVELLIASSILVAVMLSGYSAYSLYSSSWQKRTQYYWQQAQEGLVLQSVYRSINAISDYIVIDNNNKPSVYFSLTSSSVRFVTTSPIFTDAIAIAELEIIKEDKFYLLYKEKSLANEPIYSSASIINWQHEIVVMELEEQSYFTAYGWPSWQAVSEYESSNLEMKQLQQDMQPKVFQMYDFNENEILPLKINMFVGSRQLLEISLKSDSHKKLFLYAESGA